ncbi:hypothetical protein LCY76_23415 [Fictibacillus sp. KIGAM418]|uniref:Type IV secretion system protein n=1 Tax=Fictibacillus marinisediminis TaxID=2878389 RepID=A0A9X2BF60_9BACL|nr:hypothetical protein [Fictibacillus marinisediminis]MCK6259524.1 hypothetical protein [Fictibacillus marinisediminis]
MFSLFKIISPLLYSLWKDFIEPFKDLDSLNTLIFDTKDKVYGIFSKDMFKSVMDGMDIMLLIATFFLIVAIIYNGARISSAGINPTNRGILIEFVKDCLIVTFFLMNLPDLLDILFKFNDVIVKFFKFATSDSKSAIGGFKSIADMVKEDETGMIGTLFIALVLLGLTFWANFYYLMRTVTLFILIMLGPLMVVFWMFQPFKGITIGWLRELVTTIFIQSVHALVVFAILKVSGGANNAMVVMIVYCCFIPISESIRSLFYMATGMTDNLSKWSTGLGMASLAAMYGTVKGALNDKNPVEALRNTATSSIGIDKDVNPSSNLDTLAGTTSRASRMLKWGDGFKKAGRLAGGFAGMATGAGLGAKQVAINSVIGSEVGAAAGGLTGRASFTVGLVATKAGKSVINGLVKSTKGAIDGFNKAGELSADELDSIAGIKTDQWAAENETAMKDKLRTRMPNATEDEINGAWARSLADKKSQFKKEGKSGLALQRVESIQDIAEKAASFRTKDWVDKNEDAFKENLKKQHPGLSTQEIDQAWNQRKQEVGQSHLKQAMKSASNIGDSLNVDDFADQYAKDQINQWERTNKSRFMDEIKRTNPQLTESQRERAFNKAKLEKMDGFRTEAAKAIESSKSTTPLSKGFISKEQLAAKLAQNMTDEWAANQKGQFMNQLQAANPNLSISKAESQWAEREGEQYQAFHQKAMTQLPEKSRGKVLLSQMSSASKGALIGGMRGSGLAQAGEFLADTKIGVLATSVAQGVASGVGTAQSINMETDASLVSGSLQYLQGASNGLIQGVSEGIKVAGTHVAQDVTGKQMLFRNGVSFATGVLGGLKGYQAGTQMAGSYNPYNNAVKDSMMELTDIQRNVPTEQGPDGNMQSMPGSVQLVVEQDKSYLMAKGSDGVTFRASRYGSGDSSLKKGQVVYQDYMIKNDSLMPVLQNGKPSPYLKDAGGSRIAASRPVTINPNELLVNRRSRENNPQLNPVYHPFNQAVSNESFTVSDIKEHSVSQMVRLVVERDRSYVVMQDQSGKDYRVSRFGDGDPSLTKGEVIYQNYNVNDNNRIIPADINERAPYRVNGYGEIEQIQHKVNVNPNELFSQPMNARFKRRRELEMKRIKEGVV